MDLLTKKPWISIIISLIALTLAIISITCNMQGVVALNYLGIVVGILALNWFE